MSDINLIAIEKPTMKYSILKKCALLFSILFLLQSCQIYKSKHYTLDEASKQNKKAKVYTSADSYKFIRTFKKNDQYYGQTHRASRTAEHFSEHIIESESTDKYVTIKLSPEEITKGKVGGW